MTEQLQLQLDDASQQSKPDFQGFMLWYEKSKASPEQAIKNASQYFYQKYGTQPVRVVLPLKWRRKDHSTINVKPIEEALDGLVVTTSKIVSTKHVAVYRSLEE